MYPFPPLQLAASDMPPPPPPGPPPQVVVYGDSFSSGQATPPDDTGPNGWVWRLTNLLRVAPGSNAVNGTGFVRVSGGSTFPYAAAVNPMPDARVAVVFGGVNDARFSVSPEAARIAAVVTLTVIAAACPRAVLVLVAPQWPATPPTAAALAIRDSLIGAAAQVGATYVDPTGWFQGRPHLIGADGLHPNLAGNVYIAARMAPIIAAALEQAGESAT